uniref:Uncharacterized protein n=1 Tax=Tanacetum cinerariifolium TaxID=118510 RepID=A0A6L2MXG8_TANCI|nr:hypothetical protein [Tanacetum cinerariifolium]
MSNISMLGYARAPSISTCPLSQCSGVPGRAPVLARTTLSTRVDHVTFEKTVRVRLLVIIAHFSDEAFPMRLRAGCICSRAFVSLDRIQEILKDFTMNWMLGSLDVHWSLNNIRISFQTTCLEVILSHLVQRLEEHLVDLTEALVVDLVVVEEEVERAEEVVEEVVNRVEVEHVVDLVDDGAVDPAKEVAKETVEEKSREIK